MDLRFIIEVVSLPACILVASLVLANAMAGGEEAPLGSAVVLARAPW